MKLSVFFFTLVLGFFASFSFSQEVIRASVSEEFMNGLQAKYLRNIAKHMNMEIEIVPMPKVINN